MATKANNSEKYIDLISQNAKDLETEQLQFRAEEAELQVTSAILETKKQIATAKRKLAETKRAIPYSLQAEVDATVALQDLEDGLKVALTIQKARF